MCEAAMLPGVADIDGMHLMQVSGPGKQSQIDPENKNGSEKVNRVEMAIMIKGNAWVTAAARNKWQRLLTFW
jgi:hypothetical protein